MFSPKTRAHSFYDKLEWNMVIALSPLTVFLIPIVAIICVILALFGVDITWFEGFMMFVAGIFIIYAVIVLSILGGVTFLFQKIDKSLLWFHENKDTEDIDIITSAMKVIQRNLQYFSVFRYVMRFFLSQEGYKESIHKLKNELQFLIEFSILLKQRLLQVIEVQKGILEHAKSDIEENITGSVELLKASEAQQIRIDQQITYFEKLQSKLKTQKIEQ
ncbi:MAG: hypothetical protein U0518_05480 [Candidatus Gracilibacteria bacterium]